MSLLRLYFRLSVVLLVLTALTYPLVTPGSASRVVATLNLLILVPSALLSGALLYRRRRAATADPAESALRR